MRTVQSPMGLQYTFTTCPLGSGHQASSFTAPYTASPMSGSLSKWLCKYLKGKSLIIILKEDINWLYLQAHWGTVSPEVCQHNLCSHFRYTGNWFSPVWCLLNSYLLWHVSFMPWCLLAIDLCSLKIQIILPLNLAVVFKSWTLYISSYFQMCAFEYI